MGFDELLRHQLVIRRNVQTLAPVHDPPEPGDGDPLFDEYGQPIMAPVTVATVAGRIEPLSAREVALLAQSGAIVSTHRAFVRPMAGLLTDAWIEAGGVRYDIVGMPDAAGAGHHLELALQAVV
jgi:hypothetical protein